MKPLPPFRAWRTCLANALAAVLLTHTATPAYAQAGIPVFDGVSMAEQAAQHAETLAKYIEQISTLKSQLDTANRQYESITGTRNLGDILNNPAIRNTLPADVHTILKRAEDSNSSIARSIKRIKSEEATSGHFLTDKKRLDERAWEFVTTSKAALEEAQGGAADRMQQLDQLQRQINMATDPKAIADLQARMLVEQANIQSDQMRADLLAHQMQAEHALIEQQAAKLAAQSFSIDAIRAPLPGAR